MPRYKKVVVGTDGSENAARALAAAAAFAQANRAQVVVAHASANDEDAALVCKDATERITATGLKATAIFEPGVPGDVLCEVASREDADLVVVGSRGLSRAQRMLIGSVSFRVAHHSPADVLIVRNEHAPDAETPYRRVLIATDGSATADRCARKGYDVASRLGADMLMVFVGHRATGEAVLADTKRAFDEEARARKIEPLPIELRITQGEPADKIIEIAEAEGVDLIVVGNKGITSSARFLLGSVPHRVIQYAPCDVLVARTTTQVLTELEPGEGGVVKVGERKLAVYRAPDGEIVALSSKCTHLGCQVAWNATETCWDCPCHGSRFAPTGEVINGPATTPLARTDL